MALAQLVVEDESTHQSVAWRTLRWFTYAGVFIDLGGTASAIAIVNMACNAPIVARTMAIGRKDSIARRVLLELPIEQRLLYNSNEMELLRQFGMSKRWHITGWHMVISFILGSLFIFTSLSLWVWLTESIEVAACLMPVVTIVICPIVFLLWHD